VGSGSHLIGGDGEAVCGRLGDSVCCYSLIDLREAGEQGDWAVGFGGSVRCFSGLWYYDTSCECPCVREGFVMEEGIEKVGQG
jgi:hypothetical protein